MNVFTQCLNPLTGIATWQEQDEHYDYHQEVARSAFADMLHDKERNKKYYIALKNAIENVHRTGQKANVLDIGTGTGLLAMMAAKCGADTVTACEAFTPMANCAAQIIEENGFADKIKLIRKRSTKMTVGKDGDMPKRANILVTEVFDTELIGEGALLTFRHAHEALLEKDCIVIPHSGTVWVQVVESSKVNAWNRVKPIKIEKDLKLDAPSAVQACSGAAAVHDMQLSRLPPNCFVALLPPQPIFKFDWSNEESLQFKDQVVLQVQSIACGTAHAIFMWWDLNMDKENRIVLSCAPVWEHPDVPDVVKSQKDTSCLLEMADLIPWRDHWMQAVYYLPREVPIRRNEDISLVGYHDEYSFWFKLLNKPIKDVPECPRPICSCDMHIAYSRTRIGQLNDKVRNNKYIQALRNVKKDVCLCFSDGCLLGLALAKSGSKVFLLEQNFLSRKTMEKFVEANDISERVTFIDSIDDLPKGTCNDLDLIFGEPYFLSSILPWENLRFWYLAYKLPEHIRRMPCAATIRGLFVEFKDLQKIRAPLGVCESFDLSSFDELVQNSSEKSDSPIEAQPLWEYSCKALSKPFDIARFDLSRTIDLDEHIRLNGAVPIEEDGLCNGVALWVDWNLHLNCKPVSCGPIEEVIPGEQVSWDPYTRQGVHLFRNVSRVTRKNLFWWSFSFGIRHGEMKFDFSEVTKN